MLETFLFTSASMNQTLSQMLHFGSDDNQQQAEQTTRFDFTQAQQTQHPSRQKLHQHVKPKKDMSFPRNLSPTYDPCLLLMQALR